MARLGTSIPIDCRAADVDEAEAWPAEPSIVTALHACGPAADAIIDRAVATRARELLLVPCCTSRGVDAAVRAEASAASFGIPRHAPVRRRFIQAMVDAERTWRLEAAGYETEVVEFVGATVTPHNLLWRARRVGEPTRMAAAREALARLGTYPAMSWIPTDRPLVFGHRGGSRLAPENTIAAFDRAVAEGVDGLELDVRLSKDGQVMVCHDARVDRTSNTTGAIADMTASELARVDAGYRFTPGDLDLSRSAGAASACRRLPRCSRATRATRSSWR